MDTTIYNQALENELQIELENISLEHSLIQAGSYNIFDNKELENISLEHSLIQSGSYNIFSDKKRFSGNTFLNEDFENQVSELSLNEDTLKDEFELYRTAEEVDNKSELMNQNVDAISNHEDVLNSSENQNNVTNSIYKSENVYSPDPAMAREDKPIVHVASSDKNGIFRVQIFLKGFEK